MAEPRFLVTGGAGFIGSNLTAALVAAGEKVRVLDNLSTGRWAHLDGIPNQSQIERIEGDIRDAEAVAAGTVNVLDVARRQGVKRLVFAASSAAYGETPTLPKREDMAPQPLSPYAVTKLACEYYLKVFAELYGIETVSLRYFNVFGPNQTPDGAYAAAIPRFCDAALSGRPIEIFGDGEQSRDFCYVDNTVRANLLAAETKNKLVGQVINIAGGRRIELNALVRELAKHFGKDLAVEHVAPRPGDVRHSLADISRAHELIGYEPKIRWEDGLAPTIAYMRALRGEGPTEASRTMTTIRGVDR